MTVPAPHTATIRRWTASVIAALACVYAGGVFAQSFPPFNLFRGPGNVVLGTAVLNGSRNALSEQTAQFLAAAIGKSSTATSPAPPVTGPPPTLTYEPDARLSDWTRLRMTDALDPGGDPDLRHKIEQTFADNAVLEEFDRFMSERGYSSHDIADDTAELLLVSWQIATRGIPTRSQAQGVHEQVRSVFLHTALMSTLKDADRQLMAEQMAYQIMITSSAHAQALRDGTEAERQQLQQSATAILRENGVEPTVAHLTDQGFRR